MPTVGILGAPTPKKGEIVLGGQTNRNENSHLWAVAQQGLLGIRVANKFQRLTFYLVSSAIILMAQTLLLSCSVQNEKGSSQLPPPRVLRPEYLKTTAASLYGSVERYTLEDGVLSEKAVRLSKSTLVKVDLSEEYGADAYTVAPSGDSPVVLSPKLLLRTAQLGEGIQVREGSAGKATIYLSIALVNGLEREVITTAGLKSIPNSLLVKNRDGLIRELEAKLERRVELSSHVPCPTEVILRTTGVEDIPVQFRTPLRSCPFNQFFPVELNLSAENWARLMNSMIQGQSLEVAFDTDLRVPLLTQFHQFKFKKQAVHSALLDVLKSTFTDIWAPITLENVNSVLDLTLRQIQKTLGTNLKEELFGEFKSQMTHEFFLEHVGSDCIGGQSRCYLWKKLEGTQGDIQARISSYEYFGSPLQMHSSSAIANMLSELTPFKLKSHMGSPLFPPESGELNNLSMTTFEGEILEFDFRTFGKTVLEWAEPKSQYIENQKCISFGPVPTREEDDPGLCLEWIQDCNLWNNCNAWTDQCVEWEGNCCRATGRDSEHCGNFRLKDPNSKPPGYSWGCTNIHCVVTNRYCSQPVHECVSGHWYNTNICKKYAKRNVPTGEAPCLKRENQWQRITTYSVPGVSSTWIESDFTDQQIRPLVEGLSVHFDLPATDGTTALNCKLSEMDYRVLPGHRILLVFRNTERCKPFGDYTRLPGHGPSISFINQFSEPSEFQCGEMNENWQGNRTWTCRLPDGTEKSQSSTVEGDEKIIRNGGKCGIYQMYFPRTEVFGFSRAVGAYLMDRGNL